VPSPTTRPGSKPSINAAPFGAEILSEPLAKSKRRSTTAT